MAMYLQPTRNIMKAFLRVQTRYFSLSLMSAALSSSDSTCLICALFTNVYFDSYFFPKDFFWA